MTIVQVGVALGVSPPLKPADRRIPPSNSQQMSLRLQYKDLSVRAKQREPCRLACVRSQGEIRDTPRDSGYRAVHLLTP